MKHIFITTILMLSFLRTYGQNISWLSSGAGNEFLNFNSEVDLGYSVISSNDEVYLTGLVTGNKAIIQDSTINITILAI